MILVPNATHTETVEGIMCKQKKFSNELYFTRNRFGSSDDVNCESINDIKVYYHVYIKIKIKFFF
jgi:hypothetical protein